MTSQSRTTTPQSFGTVWADVAGAGTISLDNPVGIGDGGTGQVTAAAGFDALSPMSALGDLIYGGAAGTRTRLAGNVTAVRQFLNQTGNGTVSAAPAWGTLVASDLPAAYLPLTGGSLSAPLTVNGNVDISAVGSGVKVAEGVNAKMGTAVLTAGGLGTVANTSVTAVSRIFLTCQIPGGSVGVLFVNSRNAGTNFIVKSTIGTDTSVFAYSIIEPG